MLSNIIALIQANLTAQGVAAPMLVGAEHIAQFASPPRIVFSPGARDTVIAPREVGGPARQLRVRVTTLETRIWGATLADTEALLDACIIAALEVCPGTCQVSDVLWFGVDGDLVRIGYACLINFTIEIPVRKPAATLAPVKAVSTTTTIL